MHKRSESHKRVILNLRNDYSQSLTKETNVCKITVTKECMIRIYTFTRQHLSEKKEWMREYIHMLIQTRAIIRTIIYIYRFNHFIILFLTQRYSKINRTDTSWKLTLIFKSYYISYYRYYRLSLFSKIKNFFNFSTKFLKFS